MFNNERKIGVWLDHHHAHFVEINGEDLITQTIESGFSRHEREEGETATGSRFGMHPTNNENNKNNRLQNELKGYYKILTDRLAGYDHILLFGPTTAKNELHNYMKELKAFANKKIDLKNCDKLTENQLKAAVREHFQKSS
jgi:hypothetical protein